MRRTLKTRSHKAGLPPGTAVHIGEQKSETTRIHVMHYDAVKLTEHVLERIEEGASLKAAGGVSWIHVTGVHDVELLGRIGKSFGLHPLVVEDISNTDQRPKMEEYDGYVYLVIKLMHGDPSTGETVVEQLSVVLGPDFVLSFEEAEPTVFEAVRQRLRDSRGSIRAQGADYLAYSLLDSVVDNYFAVLEKFGERVEQLQEELVGKSGNRAQHALHQLRREMVRLRKSVWPLREVIGSLERGDSPLFRRETWVYLRDVYDHVIHMIDTLETQHEILTYTMDLNLLNATNRLNEIIKVLTIFATLSIPPMLIASIYGMNFRFMPELKWPWGYPFALALMAVLAGAMLVYFRRKKWF
jgi:magnesium transporter